MVGDRAYIVRSNSKESEMTEHLVVSRAEWLEARRQLLAEEKEFTQQRDALSARRRALPWVAVEKAYRFEGPSKVRRRSTTCSAERANWSSITSCSAPTGRNRARAVRSGPTATTARARIWPRAIPVWSRFSARAARQTAGPREEDGLDVSLVFLGRGRLQLPFRRQFPPRRVGDGIGVIQLSNTGDTDERSARLQRVRSRRRGYLSHLFLFSRAGST